nr:hypothetical protein [Tanacetum cinerariifolium]
PRKPPSSDRAWNTALPAAQGDAQSWISDLAKQADARSSFNELLDTPIDFSNLIMHRLNVDTLTPDLLAEQVKVRVSKILPKINQIVNEQLEAEVLTRSSNSSKTSYAVAVDLSEMELKKILIKKIEGNKSIHRSNEQRNLYKALVEAYESDKIILDTYGDTTSTSESATAEEPMQTTFEMEEPLHPEFATGADDQPIIEPFQHPEWFSQQKKPPNPDCDWNKTLPAVHKSIQPWISDLAKLSDSRSSFNELMDTPVDFSNFLMNQLKVDTLTPELLDEEPVQTTCQMEEPSHLEFDTGAEDQLIVQSSQHPEWFSQQQKPPSPDHHWNKTVPAIYESIQPWISELAKQTDSRSSFNELMDTPLYFSNFLINRLKVDTLTLKLRAGPTYELMKGSCKILVQLEYHLKEVFKATTDQLDCVNPKVAAVETTNDSPAIPQHTSVETVANVSPDNKAHFQAKKESIFLLLTGIGDEIYSTVDSYKTANKMWIAIKRLQQGESLNIQDVKTIFYKHSFLKLAIFYHH